MRRARGVALDPNISTTIGWIAKRFGSNIHVPQRMIPTDFYDPPIFPLAPP